MEKRLNGYNIYWESPKEHVFLIGYLFYDLTNWVFLYSYNIKEIIAEGFHPFIELYDIRKIHKSPLMFKTFESMILEGGEPVKHFTNKIFIKRQVQQIDEFNKDRYNR